MLLGNEGQDSAGTLVLQKWGCLRRDEQRAQPELPRALLQIHFRYQDRGVIMKRGELELER